MLDHDISYLMGLITGKGKLIRGNKQTTIIIEIPHKNLKIEGKDTQKSIKSSLLDLVGRIKPLVGADIDWDVQNKSKAYIKFRKPNKDYLIRTIVKFLDRRGSWRSFRIPKKIFKTSKDNKKEFLRGLADVTAHIRKSNLAFGINYNNRVYIEIMDNWMIVIDICNLLKSIDIPVQTIRWAHPNFVDPSLKYYKKGIKNYKEHQIKIWAEEFEKIGFNIEHKDELLEKYANLNRKNWNNKYKEMAKKTTSEKKKKKFKKKIGNIKKSHHKFYWEKRKRDKEKESHPEEDNKKIHPKIRGKHFNHWTEIAKELGYNE